MPAEAAFQQLMARLRAGDEEAAREVFGRFARRLIGLAAKHLDGRLRPKVDPEDVAQSALKSFFLRYAGGEYELAGWDDLWALLVLITLRKCGLKLKFYRAGRRDVQREQQPPPDADSGWEAVAREPTPAEAALLAETVEQLLRSLPGERERRMLELSLQGCSADEISAAVGRSARTVERVLARVRKRLERDRDEEL
jgi:RNA polymerase sigma-70 factor (ECF subfamily)